MKKPTIQEIVETTKETSPYFFDEPTLRGFGQTLESFNVAESPKGNIFIYAPSYWGSIIGNSHLRVNALGKGFHRTSIGKDYPRLEGRKLMGYTFRQVEGDRLTFSDCEKDLESILEYIKSH